jgi:DNA repair protein RadD
MKRKYEERVYQTSSEERIWAALKTGRRHILLCLPTGGGKTVVAARMIRKWSRRGKRVLFMAHRLEMIEQCYQLLLEFGIAEADIGIIMATDARANPSARIQIASVQTLALRRLTVEFDVVIVDEAHHAVAASYRNILRRCSRAVRLGLTATPYRLDGVGLGDLYDELIVGAQPSELIASGFLAKPTIWSVPTDKLPDMKCVRVSGDDYDMLSAEAVLNTSAMVASVTEEWGKRAEGRPTVAYTTTVKHATSMLESFRAAGARAAVIHGATPTTERTLLLGMLARKEIEVLINCMVLTEGWNCPEAKCAILARPTMSTALFVQMVGRILRVVYGGLSPLVLDHVGNTLVHGLPHEDRLMTLDGLAPGKAGRPPAKQCPECLHVMPTGRQQCDVCGHEFPARATEPRQSAGDLEMVDEASWWAKKSAWEALALEANDKNMTMGWAKLRFGKRFGHPPPRSFLEVA